MDYAERLRALFHALETDLCDVKGFPPAVTRLSQRMRKRARLGDPNALHQKAVDDFRTINDRMATFVVDLPDDVCREARHFLLVMLENYTTSVMPHDIQVSLDVVHLHDLWRFGPGASFETSGTHAAEKIGQKWTTSQKATSVLRKLRKNNPYLSAYDGVTSGLIEARGSSLKSVPKNEETNRTIAFEPCGNMVAQLAAGEYISRALARIGLDISGQQPKNKAMAQKGSLDGTLATIDLKAASDTISPELVRLLLPPEWYELFMSVRSEEILLDGGEWVKVNMISTMGNGFTFALMTAIITSLIYGFRSVRDRRSPRLWIDWNHTCVYGDDIIIPVDEYDGFCSLLERAGFIVNHDKSFAEGPFRESCGGDYYEGRDITPFYIKKLENNADVYVALNKVTNWCGRENLYLPNTFDFLFKQLKGKPFFVPEWSNPDQGYMTALVERRYKLLRPFVEKRPYPSDGWFLMPLACGGYVSSSPVGVVYMPRQNKTRYVTHRSRLPNGFLDGRDPLTRDPSTSALASFIASASKLANPEVGC
jgi:hypothetical protein